MDLTDKSEYYVLINSVLILILELDFFRFVVTILCKLSICRRYCVRLAMALNKDCHMSHILRGTFSGQNNKVFQEGEQNRPNFTQTNLLLSSAIKDLLSVNNRLLYVYPPTASSPILLYALGF